MIQKSELKQVPVEQRVPGRWYGSSDTVTGWLDQIVCHKEGRYDTSGTPWEYYFELPESMLPVRELPDEFELKAGEWEKLFRGEWSDMENSYKLRRAKSLPKLTIPSGSKSEQIAELEKILAELKQS